MIVVVGLVAIVIAGAFWYISTMNNLRQMLVKVDEAQSSIGIMLVKRYDTLMDSMKAVKGYVKHENEVFMNFMPPASNSLTDLETAMASQKKAFDSLMAVGNLYPELKSSELFKNFQNQIADENEHLAAAKRCYNSNVTFYNQKAIAFPTSIVANAIGKGKLEFLKEENLEAKREINIEF